MSEDRFGIMPDWIISEYAAKGMIEPFVDKQINLVEYTGEVRDDIEMFVDKHSRRKVISYGLGSFGYDIRIADTFMVFPTIEPSVMDPKQFAFTASSKEIVRDVKMIVPPNTFVLGYSVEYFRIPNNVVAFSVNKSTYARCGIFCNITALEPGWEGNLTIEITNMTPFPAIIYANEGIAQLMFFECRLPEINYADRNGKYQGQQGVQIAKS